MRKGEVWGIGKDVWGLGRYDVGYVIGWANRRYGTGESMWLG